MLTGPSTGSSDASPRLIRHVRLAIEEKGASRQASECAAKQKQTMTVQLDLCDRWGDCHFLDGA